MLIGPRTGNILGFLACAGLMGYALYAQHVLGLEPCPLCIFQRYAFVVTGAIALVATLHGPGRVAQVVYGLLIAGHETTTSMSANAIVTLMQHSDAWERLCAEPALIPNAVPRSTTSS